MLLTEDAFYSIIQDTWNSTLGFEVNRSDSEALSNEGQITVCTRVSGAWNGEVRLRCPPPLGRMIAAAFFQIEAPAAGNDQILDALSELIHIVGGNLKALLPQPITLLLPSMEESGKREAADKQHQTVCQLSLMSKDFPFTITLQGGPSTGIGDPSPFNRTQPQTHADDR